MITRIELTNFMAHHHTVIEPAAGLTVLVGPNNVGKSAVVAALQILCQNESAAYVMRHGERECSVAVQTDDGHNVEWRRKNSSQSYTIDGQIFDRLKGRTPDELHQALRMPMVDAESDADFDVHFGTQKSPIFLLNSPATNRARFFASSSDAIQLVAMQKRHKEKLSERQKEKLRLETESRKLNEELEFLKPVSDINEQVASATCLYDELIHFESWLKEAERHKDALERQQAAVVQHMSHARVLSYLSAPPILIDIRPLERMIDEVAAANCDRARENSRASALLSLAAPPELAKTENLSLLIQSLEQAESRLASAASRAAALNEFSSPPRLEDIVTLSDLTRELSALDQKINQYEQEQWAVSSLASPPLLADTEDLRRIIVRLATSARELQLATGELGVLEAAGAPPALLDDAPLAVLHAAIAKSSSQHKRWQAESDFLTRLISPPVPIDLECLAEVVYKFDKFAEEVRSWASQAAAAEAELRQTGEELRMRTEGTECPICGNPLDADAVLARAAVGLGGHAHV